MEEVELAIIKGKIVKGVAALISRTFIIQVITQIANLVLLALLSQYEYGIYWIVIAIISFLSYFSDIGLAAALIQKKEDPTRQDLVTAFTIQQILVGIIVIFTFVYTPSLSSFFHLTQDTEFVIRAFIISFFLSSLKTIPSVILERKLDFTKLILPQIFETAAFYLVTIILALSNFGVASFAWAAVVRGIVGLVAIYLINPWPIGIGISRKSIRHLLTFGIPFQLNSCLALIKDDLMTLFLGRILSFSRVHFIPPTVACAKAPNICEIGYIGVAKRNAEISLKLVMDNVIRVTFPVYSRLQKDMEILGKAVQKSLTFLALLIIPSNIILAIYIKPIMHLIPKYAKWEPTLFSFYFFSFSSVMSSFSTPLFNALNAIGKVKTTLILMIFWTTLTWILYPIFVYFYGYNGVSMAAFVISFTAIIPVFIMKKFVQFSVISSLYKPVIISFITALPAFILMKLSQDLLLVIFSLALTFGIYTLLVWLWMGEDVRPYLPHQLAGLPKFFKRNK
ncbi:oligosaccharide flippase family protein [Candidatus Gottesmanbacteria bacterium]|nr:oligosaccharide flippase family protein [Candidatus Gottesmanbacteria bacterium]